MIVFLIEVVIPLLVVASILYVAINDQLKRDEWAKNFKAGTKVFTKEGEEGTIICIKNNKAYVRFFHGIYWKYLDTLVPYNEFLD